ncbi:hypothetical protein F5Y13DRAFT_196948 [Hypoxylon sp. FL1857]|nr:hypothetical protein F5Y13DRAFT_196948 [Hypoxylon sp. FL1857]
MMFLTFLALLVAILGAAGAKEPTKTSSRSEAGLTTTTTTDLYGPMETALIDFDYILIDDFSVLKEDGKLTELDALFGFPVGRITPEAPPILAPVDILVYTSTTNGVNLQADQAVDPVLDDNVLANNYNTDHPGNRIPSFVWCVSTRGAARRYNRTEIYLAIQQGLYEMSPTVHRDDRTFGPTWPRPLGTRRGYLRPREVGEATGRLFEYPLGVRDIGLRPHPVDDYSIPAIEVIDRVTFDRDGLFTGILRYHDSDHWHYCYPEGWHSMLAFRRRHAAPENGAMHSPEAMWGAVERWGEDFRAGYEAESSASQTNQTDQTEPE